MKNCVLFTLEGEESVSSHNSGQCKSASLILSLAHDGWFPCVARLSARIHHFQCTRWNGAVLARVTAAVSLDVLKAFDLVDHVGIFRLQSAKNAVEEQHHEGVFSPLIFLSPSFSFCLAILKLPISSAYVSDPLTWPTTCAGTHPGLRT